MKLQTRSPRWGATIAVLSLVALAGFSRASEIHVSVSGDDSNSGSPDAPVRTIQHGVDMAGDGDTVQVGPGTYGESVSWSGRAIQLVGSGAGSTIIDPSQGPGGRCLTLTDVPSPGAVRGFTLQNGNSPTIGGMLALRGNVTVGDCVFQNNWDGGLYIYMGDGRVENCTFTNNSGTYGGGAYCYLGSQVIENCTFQYNWVAAMGGGLVNDNNNVIVRGCTFDTNYSDSDAGAILNWFSNAQMSNCTFNYNTCPWSGGAVHNRGNSPLMEDCYFYGNGSYYWNSGALYNNGSNAQTERCTFQSNWGSYGGAVMNDWCTPSFADCRFYYNSAYLGGAMRSYGSNPSIADCLFEGNSASYGGAFFDDYASATSFSRCRFYSNSAFEGGGLMLQSANTRISDSTFWGNSATYGGGLFCWTGSPVLTNTAFFYNNAWEGGGADISRYSNGQVKGCTFGHNSAAWGGGLLTFMADVQVSNSTLAGNTAWYDGGGMLTYLGNVPVANTIVWSNDWNSIANYSSNLSLAYCDVQGWFGASPDANGNFSADPRFFDLGNGDLSLRLFTPCLNRGSNALVPGDLATDLWGHSRISGSRVDVGAFEIPFNGIEAIQGLIGEIQERVAGGTVLPADGQSLIAKLNAAINALQNGNSTAARNALDAFVNQVKALVQAKKLSQAEAQPLLDYIQQILTGL